MNKIFKKFFSTYKDYALVKKPKNPLRCTIKLGEEVGEVSEAVLAITGNKKKTAKILEQGQSLEEHLIEELGDVMVVLFHISESFHIDQKDVLQYATHKMRAKIDASLND